MTEATQKAVDSRHFEGADKLRYWGRFSIMLAISVVIATAGLYRNSGAVVIAAMLIAPLMTPILGIATSLVLGWTKRLLNLFGAVSLASAGTVLLANIIMYIGDAPQGMVVPGEVLARTNPGLEELMVALASGTAGAYVQMRKEEFSLLPGVAIGVSLVPPLAAAGMLFYFNDQQSAWEAIFLFITNLAAIVFSACLVFLALGVRPRTYRKGHFARVSFGTATTFAIVAVIAYHLTEVTLERFREARAEERVVAAALTWAGQYPVEVVYVDVKPNQDSYSVELWVIFDVPQHFADDLMSPREKLAADLKRSDLFKTIVRALRSEATLVMRSQIRYSGQFSLPDGTYLGLPSKRSHSR
ncbi:MAG: DUF389 domain-containing protein [Hyphomicrobiales bacterium]